MGSNPPGPNELVDFEKLTFRDPNSYFFSLSQISDFPCSGITLRALEELSESLEARGKPSTGKPRGQLVELSLIVVFPPIFDYFHHFSNFDENLKPLRTLSSAQTIDFQSKTTDGTVVIQTHE